MNFNVNITIVMPALNEEGNIKAAVECTIRALDEANVNGELIIVNDGSTDNTGNIAEELRKTDKRIFVIHHDTPKGIGYSFWEGVSRANNEAVVLYPGDNEMLPAEMLLYLHELSNVDIVVPFIVNETVRSPFRRLMSGIYTFMIRILFGLNVHHSNGLVLYRRSILKDIKLKSHGFFYQTELLCKTVRRGYLYAEVPYYTRPRASGKSKAFSIKSILNLSLNMSRLLAELLFSEQPKELDASSVTAFRRKKLERILTNKICS